MDHRPRMDSVSFMHQFQLMTDACATVYYVGGRMVTVITNLLAS